MTDYMPSIEQYMAVARALHDESDLCNANHDIPFEQCDAREADITDAIRMLVGLHRDDWALIRQPVGVPSMGL